MLVAVRAIAPVAGIPPKSGEAMLATPCATSSMLERCRPPIMPSATTAERSDSIAPRAAMAKAGPTSSRASASETNGSTGLGRPEGISPNRLPIVSTGSCEQLRPDRAGEQRDQRRRDPATQQRPEPEHQQREHRDADRGGR